jgi:hypothetical protein
MRHDLVHVGRWDPSPGLAQISPQHIAAAHSLLPFTDRLS